LTLPRGAAEWLDRWSRDDSPNAAQAAEARAWLEALEASPRQPPSTETAWPFPRATGELRVAYLIGADAFIVYAVEGNVPRVLYVGLHPPDDIEFRLP
jgi:hypothetical protein